MAGRPSPHDPSEIRERVAREGARDVGAYRDPLLSANGSLPDAWGRWSDGAR
jgi:hypothetical protein